MQRLRFFAINSLNAMRSVLIMQPQQMQVRRAHDHGPPQPFDNMPFRVTSRFAATAVFGIFFGLGFWAPYLIVWYSMAKRTL